MRKLLMHALNVLRDILIILCLAYAFTAKLFIPLFIVLRGTTRDNTFVLLLALIIFPVLLFIGWVSKGLLTFSLTKIVADERKKVFLSSVRRLSATLSMVITVIDLLNSVERYFTPSTILHNIELILSCIVLGFLVFKMTNDIGT